MNKTRRRLITTAAIAAAAVMAIAAPAGTLPAQIADSISVNAGAVSWNTVSKFSQLKTAIENGMDNIKLKADITMTEALEITEDTTINLNGYKISCKGNCRAFINNATLTITDNSSKKNGKITGGYEEQGGAVYNDGVLRIEAGIIENNQAEEGGAIYNAPGAELVITGGTISGNEASEDGGAIYAAKSSIVDISGKAVIEANYANQFGGAIYSAGAVITLDGGSVSENDAGRKGGGIYEDSSTSKVTVNSGTFSGNSPQDFANSNGKDYKKGNVTVSFDSNGGSRISSFTVTNGDKLGSTQTPTRDGYKFLGWTLNGKYVDSSTRITENVTLVAQWEKKADVYYTVKYDTNGGSFLSAESVKEGSYASLPTPTRSGYLFDGWTLNGVYYNYKTAVTGNITLVAHWTKRADTYYTVTYDSNGGTRVSSESVKEGNKVSIPFAPARDGYTFTGWTLNGRLYDFSTPVNSNLNLVAQWKRNSYCTVTLRVQGGLYDTLSIKSGSYIGALPVPKVSGYEFIGWTLNGRYIDNYEVIYSDCTLNAEFVEVATYCTVTLRVEGGLYDTLSVKSGSYIGALPAPKISGYEFKGWTLNGRYIDNYEVIYSDCTLNAEFTEIGTSYTVKFYLTREDVTPISTKTVKEGDIIGILPSTDNVGMAGYEFLGWTDGYIDVKATTQVYSDMIIWGIWYDMINDFYIDNGGYYGGLYGNSIDAANEEGEYSAENSDETDESGIDLNNIAVDSGAETASTKEPNPKTGVEDIAGAAGLTAIFAGLAYLFRKKNS